MQRTKATEIVDAARNTMMERGYNGFSFRDIATDVGIKSASIHYHFPTKAALAEAAAKAYREGFAKTLDDLPPMRAPVMLAAYGELFVETLNEQGKACLGGVLATDGTTLPAEVRAEVERFFEDQRSWLAQVIRDGQTAGDIRSDIDPDVFAMTFVTGLEGAMVVARAVKQPEHLSQAIEQLVSLIRV